ncbi:MAG TPA: hypothetical protein VMS43_03695 [Allosphingosinicella sp.]|nr:hypothetical protein [Allosphingosinicella sp.]
MRVSRGIAAILCAAPLAACAVAGPVLDRAMDDAPTVACTERPAFLRRTVDGRAWIPFEGTMIGAGTEVLAMPAQAGNFTHVVLTGDGGAAGAMRVAVPDLFGRGDRGQTRRWREARQRWTVDNIGTALHNPAGVRIAVLEGSVRIDRVCFKSYLRTPVPRPPDEGQEPHDAHAH